MANLTMYNLAGQVDPRIYEIFEARLEGCDQEKIDKVLSKVDTLVGQGKKLERAMADALQEYKIT